jgi:hypothetical protein
LRAHNRANNNNQQGLPWGYLEQQLTALAAGEATGAAAQPLAPGLLFPYVDSDEARPWFELVTPPAGQSGQSSKPQVGTFSAATLARYPLSYQTTDAWVALVERSAQLHGATWLHHLHLGVAGAETGPLSFFFFSCLLLLLLLLLFFCFVFCVFFLSFFFLLFLLLLLMFIVLRRFSGGERSVLTQLQQTLRNPSHR